MVEAEQQGQCEGPGAVSGPDLCCTQPGDTHRPSVPPSATIGKQEVLSCLILSFPQPELRRVTRSPTLI